MFITFLITAAIVGAFTAVAFIFMNAVLTLYDKIVSSIKRRIMAARVVKIREDGRLEPGTVVMDQDDKLTAYTDVHAEPISPNDVDDDLAAKVAEAKRKNQKFVEVELSEEAEEEIRSRA